MRGIFTMKSWVLRMPGEDQITRLPLDSIFNYLEEELLENMLSGLCDIDVEEVQDSGLLIKVIPFQEVHQNVVPFPDRLQKSEEKDGKPSQSYLFPESFHQIPELEAEREVYFKELREAARERRKARKKIIARCEEKAAELRAKYGDDIGIEYQTATGDVFWYRPLFNLFDENDNAKPPSS